MRLFDVVVLLCFTPLSARADDPSNPSHPALVHIQSDLEHCTETQPGNINEMLCAIAADRAVDALLNTLYGNIHSRLNQTANPDHDSEERKELLKRLVASERSWIAYREAECSHASAAMLGGKWRADNACKMQAFHAAGPR